MDTVTHSWGEPVCGCHLGDQRKSLRMFSQFKIQVVLLFVCLFLKKTLEAGKNNLSQAQQGQGGSGHDVLKKAGTRILNGLINRNLESQVLG